MPPTTRAAGTAAAPVITWARTFPAVPAQVREARRFLAGLLDGSPAASDALVCLSELASNAVVHSRSSQVGGTVTVRVRLAGQRLRVEVCDQGGAWYSPGRPGTDEPNGRGLLIVSQLAIWWGCEGHSRTGWTVWFEMGLSVVQPDAALSASSESRHAGSGAPTCRTSGRRPKRSAG